MRNKFEITLAAARVNVDLTQKEVVEILKEDYGITLTRQKLSDYEKDSTDLPISLAKALTSIYKISEENIFFGTKSTLSYALRLKKSNDVKQPAWGESMEKKMNKKEHYLTKFKRNNDVEKFGFSKEVEESGKAILAELKNRDLTYDDAYASLQWVYNKLQYESNFIKIR